MGGQDWAPANAGRTGECVAGNKLSVPKTAREVTALKAAGFLATEKRFGAGSYKNVHTTRTGLSAKKLEADDVGTITKVDKSLSIAIMQARTAKKMTRKELATAINEKPQVVAEHESGKAISNPSIISKSERSLGVRLPRPGTKSKVPRKTILWFLLTTVVLMSHWLHYHPCQAFGMNHHNYIKMASSGVELQRDSAIKLYATPPFEDINSSLTTFAAPNGFWNALFANPAFATVVPVLTSILVCGWSITGTVNGVKSDITEFKADIKVQLGEIKSDITGIKSDITGIKSDITGINSKITEIADIKVQLGELTGEIREIKLDIKRNEAGIDDRLKILHEQISLESERRKILEMKIDHKKKPPEV